MQPYATTSAKDDAVRVTLVRNQEELRAALELGGWIVEATAHTLRSTHLVQGRPCILIAAITPHVIQFVLEADWVIPRWQRPAVALAIAGINARLAIGCLSLDPETGIIRSRVASHLPEQGIPCQTVFDLVITAACQLHDHWQQILHPRPLAVDSGNSESLFSRIRLHASDPEVPGPARGEDLDAWEPLDLVYDRERWRNRAVVRDPVTKRLCGIISVDAEADENIIFHDRQGKAANLRSVIKSGARNGHRDLRVLYERGSDSEPLRAALKGAGLTQHYEEIFVHARLDTTLPLLGDEISEEIEWHEGYTFSRKLLDEFLTGTPNRGLYLTAERNAVRAAMEHAPVATTGTPARGFVAVAHGDDSGTILLLAVHPEARGQGLGRLLHAAALHYLDMQGVTDYFDMTDDQNVPMQRLFFRHGASLLGSIVIHHRSGRPRGG